LPKSQWYPVSSQTQCAGQGAVEDSDPHEGATEESVPHEGATEETPPHERATEETAPTEGMTEDSAPREESSLLSVRGEHSSEARRRLPPVSCRNRHGALFQCAGGDRCCGDICVARGDICCENVDGYFFPCQGQGGQCCGNACAAPGSKCCGWPLPKSQWYPVSSQTQCARLAAIEGSASQEGAAEDRAPEESALREASSLLAVRGEQNSEARRRLPPVSCRNRHGTLFQCAGGDRCCGDICVARGDICCENVDGYFFPCHGHGGQCCGNACAAPGSKCCRSPFKPKSQWYPVTRATQCAW